MRFNHTAPADLRHRGRCALATLYKVEQCDRAVTPIVRPANNHPEVSLSHSRIEWHSNRTGGADQSRWIGACGICWVAVVAVYLAGSTGPQASGVSQSTAERAALPLERPAFADAQRLF